MNEERWKAVALIAIGWAALASATAWNNARTVDQVTRQLTDAKRAAAIAAPVMQEEPAPSPIRAVRRVQTVPEHPDTRCIDGMRFLIDEGTAVHIGSC